MATQTIEEVGNNETVVTGIIKSIDGSYVALTRTRSKQFKTEQGAARWLADRGYRADGTKR